MAAATSPPYCATVAARADDNYSYNNRITFAQSLSNMERTR
jgi:hypothetical protein